MTDRMTSECMHLLGVAYYARIVKHGITVSEAELLEKGWVDFEPWTGELDMFIDGDGRRWLTDADEPRHAVEVTDRPISFESDHDHDIPPGFEHSPTGKQARRLLDAWPECTGVNVSVSYYRKETTPRIVALDIGFKDGTSLVGDDCWGRAQPGTCVVVKLGSLVDEMIARGYEREFDDSRAAVLSPLKRNADEQEQT